MQIVLGILAIIIIATLIIVKSQTFSNTKKITVIKTVAAVIALLWLYEYMVDSKASENREIVLDFNHGKNIICDNKIITSENFYYENGTESFVAKDTNLSLSGLIYPISECELKRE